MLRVGFYQFRPRFGAIESNCRKVVAALDGIAADLVVLPELAFTGYYFRNRKEALSLAEDPRESATVDALVDLCRTNRLHVVTGFAERAGDGCFNSALLIGPRGVASIYRKLHLFNEEKRWFDPGDAPPPVVRVRGVPLGLMICFDWIFPEVARSLALGGARVLCHPSNLVLDYCQRAMLTRSLENAVFSVTCNRIGADRRPQGTLAFTGRSQIVGPRGDLLHRAPKTRERIHVVEIDPAAARDKKITPRNHLLRDRRPEFY
jgi:predicted amidohydrolase